MPKFNVNTMRGTTGDEYETIHCTDDLEDAKRVADDSGLPAWVERTDNQDENGSYHAHKTRAYLKWMGAIGIVAAAFGLAL